MVIKTDVQFWVENAYNYMVESLPLKYDNSAKITQMNSSIHAGAFKPYPWLENQTTATAEFLIYHLFAVRNLPKFSIIEMVPTSKNNISKSATAKLI